MEGNGRKWRRIKSLPLLATRNEAKQSHSEVMLPHRARVNGVPNEATVVSFPASSLGVNEAKQGQMGPEINPLHTSALISPWRGCEVPAFARTKGVSRERWGGVSLWLNLFYSHTCVPLGQGALNATELRPCPTVAALPPSGLLRFPRWWGRRDGDGLASSPARR